MEPSTRLSQDQRLSALLAVLAAQVVAGIFAVLVVLVVFPKPTVDRVEHLKYVVLAITFAQAILLAIWNALGHGKLVLRPIASLVCVICLWVVAYGALEKFHLYAADPGPVGIALFVQWVLIQVPLWIARLTFGWHIGTIDEQNTASGPKDVQFGIKHLIAWMTFVAIVLAVGKSLLLVGSLESRDALALGLFILFNCLFAWPTAVGSLVNRWMPVAMLLALGCAFGVAYSELLAFKALTGGVGNDNVFWWVDSIQFVWIAGSLLIVRWFGFRLVRPRTAKDA